jgi:hypothetical protein
MAMFAFRLFDRMPVLAFSAEVSSFAQTPQCEVIYKMGLVNVNACRAAKAAACRSWHPVKGGMMLNCVCELNR